MVAPLSLGILFSVPSNDHNPTIEVSPRLILYAYSAFIRTHSIANLKKKKKDFFIITYYISDKLRMTESTPGSSYLEEQLRARAVRTSFVPATQLLASNERLVSVAPGFSEIAWLVDHPQVPSPDPSSSTR